MGSLDPSHDDTLALAATTGDTRTTADPGIDLGHVPTGHERSVQGALLGRDVALKQLRTRGDGATARFLREARIQGRLDHPAVVPVHEVAIGPDGRPVFVMKRLTGTTLAAILAPAGHDKPPLARLSRTRLIAPCSWRASTSVSSIWRARTALSNTRSSIAAWAATRSARSRNRRSMSSIA